MIFYTVYSCALSDTNFIILLIYKMDICGPSFYLLFFIQCKMLLNIPKYDRICNFP